jgi:multidrug efflux pump
MRRTLGTAVFSGMIGVTFFGIFLTPVFFYVIRRISGQGSPPAGEVVHATVPGVNGALSAPTIGAHS